MYRGCTFANTLLKFEGVSMAGRPRKPTRQKIIQGTFRSDQENPNEPKYDPVRLDRADPPAYLNKYAKAYWKQYLPELIDKQIVTSQNLPAFEMLVQTFGDWKEAEYSMTHDERGRKRSVAQYMSERNHAMNKMPEWVMAKSARADFYRFAAHFGLTPSTQAKVSVPNTEKKVDVLNEMFKEANG